MEKEIKLRCPRCESDNIALYRNYKGSVWCEDCLYSEPNAKLFAVSEKEDAIDQIQEIRTKNNVNWMDIVRLALKHNPEETKEILKRIVNHDKEVVSLCEKIAYDR